MDMTLEFILRILLSGILGTAIGFDRERHAKEAGFRTHFLVATGSALMMIISQYGFVDVMSRTGTSMDPSRIASLVVSGIGFIGAGTIILQKQIVRGLTTAAGLWATAGIGLAVGAGMYVLGIAMTVIVLIGLVVLNMVFRNVGLRSCAISFTVKNKCDLDSLLKRFADREHYIIVSYEMEENHHANETEYHVDMVIKSTRKDTETPLMIINNEYPNVAINRVE